MSKLIIAGLDFDTWNVDVVTLPWDQDTPRWHRFPCNAKSDDGEWRSFRFARTLGKLLRSWPGWEDIDIVYIERPYGRGDSIHKLMRMQGAVIASIPQFVPVVEEIHVGEWKKVLTGNGNATKDSVVAKLRGLGFDLVGATQDAWDALAIAWAGRELNAQGVHTAERVVA